MIRTRRLPDGSVEAAAEVVVGVETREVVVPLGRPVGEIDPGWLRNTPVIVLTSAALEPMACAAAERAGRASVSPVRLGSGDRLGLRLLEAAADAEVLTVVVAVDEVTETLVVSRALRGRPLPVVPFDDPPSARRMFEACWVDLDIALPSLDGPGRAEVRAVVAELGLFASHHVVEVDPRPGLDGRGRGAPSLHELAAAATGVLAGRVAAGNRRWR